MRLYTLDWLRGIAASLIMVYHYVTWTYPETLFFGRIGFYGVSIFYVLSGLTLYHVYHAKMNVLKDYLKFFKKRVFRIFPLLWLVTLISAVFYGANGNLISNLTGWFALHPETEVATGAWSIGNELVFYLFFPLFLLTLRSKAAIVITSILLFGIYCYFAFQVITPGRPVKDQWYLYVNPFNQIFLFYAGILLGLIKKKFTSNWWALGVIVAGLLLFCYPTHDFISMITGVRRIIFTFGVILICFGVYKLQLRDFVPLSKLGEWSYSIYLLHPITYSLFINFDFRIPLSILITLVWAYFTYTYYEKIFTLFGRARLTRFSKTGL